MSEQYCTFYLNSHFFGIEISLIQEIIHFPEMLTVPLAPPSVRGLINLRGQIVAAVDLRRLLNFEPLSPEAQPINVIINSDGEPISLLVDKIGDVIKVSSENFETPPQTLDWSARRLIRGAYKLENELLLALDITKTIELVV